jgi:hypothetical protein
MRFEGADISSAGSVLIQLKDFAKWQDTLAYI